MANEVRVLIKANDQASGAIKGVGAAAEKASGPLGDISKIAAGFVVGQGLMKLPGVLSGMVGAASDLAEAGSKVNVVFGPDAVEVTQFAKLADNIGLSDEAALTATGTFGNLFVSMGMSTKTAAGMSVDIVKLAADLASFNNIEIADALQKLQSGLVGETEPLRALGVNLSADAVAAKALEMGLAATKGELTAADKATASYNLILEQTKTAQGDFERTSDGLANKQRMLKADIADLQAEIGQKLVPAFDAGVTAMGGMVDIAGKIQPSTAGIALVGTAALVAAPKIAAMGKGVGDMLKDMRKGEGTLNTFGNRLGALTVGIIAADVASQAFTGRSLTERVIGDVAKSEAAEDALSALDAKIGALGPSADRAAAATDLLWETNEKLSSGAVRAEKEVGGFMNVLTGSDGRIFGFNVGASEAVDNMKDMEAAVKLAAQEMRAGNVPVEDMMLAYQKLNPELRDAFDAGSNIVAIWTEQTGGLTGLMNVLPEVQGAYEKLVPSLEGVGTAADGAVDPLAEWGKQVTENKDGTKDWDKALTDIMGTLTTASPAYLSTAAAIAVTADKVHDLKEKGDSLTESEKAEIEVLEARLAALNATKDGYDSNTDALDALVKSTQTYISPDVAGALLNSMKASGEPAQAMIEKFSGLQSVYDHLSANDVPGAITAFQTLRGEMTDEEWAIASKSVGIDVVDGIKDGVTDPAKRSELLGAVKDTVGGATGLALTGTDPFPPGAYDLGLGVSTGVAAGVTAGAPVIQAALARAASDAVAGVKKILGISSPSKVFAEEVGIPIAQGVAIGMTQGFNDYVIPTAEEMAANAAALAAITVAPLQPQMFPDAGIGAVKNDLGRGTGLYNGDAYPIPFGEMVGGMPNINIDQARQAYFDASGRMPTDEELQRSIRGMLTSDMQSLAMGSPGYVGGSFMDYFKPDISAEKNAGAAAHGGVASRAIGRVGDGATIVINTLDAASFRDWLKRGGGDEIAAYFGNRKVFA